MRDFVALSSMAQSVATLLFRSIPVFGTQLWISLVEGEREAEMNGSWVTSEESLE